MAARRSSGLFLCAALLLAMPARAATIADRAECDASANKPELGRAACSRIIDDPSTPIAQRVQAYNNRGVAHFGLHDYDAALADHDEAIKLDPGNAFAHVRHGMAWMEKGEFERAIADINDALVIDPKYAF